MYFSPQLKKKIYIMYVNILSDISVLLHTYFKHLIYNEKHEET